MVESAQGDLWGRKWDSPLDGTRRHPWYPWVLLPRRSREIESGGKALYGAL